MFAAECPYLPVGISHNLTTGMHQDCVLNPLLQSMYVRDCVALYNIISIFKFVDKCYIYHYPVYVLLCELQRIPSPWQYDNKTNPI